MIDAIWLGWRQLTRRRARAFLLSLGVATGVAVVLGTFSIVQSSQVRLRSVLEDLGTRVVLITPESQSGTLPAGSAQTIEGIHGVESVAAFVSNRAALVMAGPPLLDATPLAVTDVLAGDGGIASVLSLAVTGRDVRPLDSVLRRPVAVLGAGVAKQMGLTPEQLLKSALTVDGEPHQIVGVLEPSIGLTSIDTTLFIANAGTEYDASVLFIRTEQRLAESVGAIAERSLRIADHSKPVTVRSARSLAKAEVASSQVLRWAATGTSLFAAAVGIISIWSAMNNSVRMRRREIGLQRAFGVSRIRIALAIMVECFGIGIVGALLGFALGVGTAMVVTLGRGWPLSLDWGLTGSVLPAAVIFSALAGVVPGMRASRIDPVDSLRSD